MVDEPMKEMSLEAWMKENRIKSPPETQSDNLPDPKYGPSPYLDILEAIYRSNEVKKSYK